MRRVNTCPKCRALLEPKTRTCPYCGTDTRHLDAPTPGADARATQYFGFWVLSINLALFAATVVLDPFRADQAFLTPSGESLIVFGSCHSFFVEHCGQWWRMLTAAFLHGGPLHLLFNSYAVLILLPISAVAFGSHRTIAIYLLAGVGGFFVSNLQSTHSVGASGALCGLIGALLAWGHRRGGLEGEQVKRRMLTWTAYLVILGFLFSERIDNWGHAGGFAVGLGLGWIGARVRMHGGREDRLWRVGAIAVVGAAVAVAVVFAAPSAYRGLQRRDVLFHHAELRRALESVQEVARGDAPAGELPAELPEGPGDTAAVRESILAAARAARSGEGADTALGLARARLEAWRTRAVCRYSLLDLMR